MNALFSGIKGAQTPPPLGGLTNREKVNLQILDIFAILSLQEGLARV